MYNISILTNKDLEYSETEKSTKISTFLELLSDNNIRNFAESIIHNIPTYFLNALTQEDLKNFIFEAYEILMERANKNYYIQLYNSKKLSLLAHNLSLIILVTDDRPFLIDSIREYFFEKNFERFFIIHPIINVKRNEEGIIENICKHADPKSNESMVFLFLENVTGEFLQSASHELGNIYNEVILTVDSFDEIKSKIKAYKKDKEFLTSEVKDYLEWLMEDNFIFMGIKEIVEENYSLNVNDIGISKIKRIKFDTKQLIKLVRENKINRVENYPIYINKYVAISKVKRREPFDLIGLIYNRRGVYKFYIILGLFSNKAIKTSPFEIALIKNKLINIIKYYNFIEKSHDYKWLVELLTNFPKVELFNYSNSHIIQILNIIFSMSIKNQICVYWSDLFPQKHLFLFLAAPLEKFSYELVQKISHDFENLYEAKIIDKSVREDEHGFFYLHLHFYLFNVDVLRNIDEATIKNKIYQYFREWDDELYDILVDKLTWHKGVKIFNKYKNAFTSNYKSKNNPRAASIDIEKLENLKSSDYESLLSFYGDELVLKVYSNRKILLTELMPVINDAGLSVFEEEIFNIKALDGEKFIHTFFIAYSGDKKTFVDVNKYIVEEMVIAVLEHRIESDMLNSLAILTAIDYRSIDFLRAIRNYIEQLNITISRASINSTLVNNYKISKELISYIDEKFNPALKVRNHENKEKILLTLVDKVESINDDKILRCFIEIIGNILRCNLYVKPKKDYISFKVNSKNISFMVEPKPLYEIFVHSYKLKGIHLRAGKIARGGIRLSDRIDDFRFEILGLMRTQIIKNAIIVPTGAKGGFVLEKSNFDAAEEYRKFISGLLDITDNYVKGKIKHPKNVMIYDENDPYLVVAADKGTASFSDIANEISNKYNFWLKDAFASGGTTGYNHKELGVTARGAWESVKRHFLEANKDIERESFSAIAIGDMSGDVFGNGMLLSKNMKLLAAFNHKHIFLDPNPDPLASFNERSRIFKLPKSSWKDYNADIISCGGGIFRRDAKKIVLSREVKEMLNIEQSELSGEELIKSILKMKADLLWNGGIGTYVKDKEESHTDVADHVNDNVRINADELNVMIVGEGGNLGFTQRARVSYALHGGRINTDALDNSAGVDTSDHEVNLKILLNNVEESGTIDKSNKYKLIKTISTDIVEAVLNNNYEQNLIVSLDLIRAEDKRLEFENSSKILVQKNILNLNQEKILFIKENRSPVRPELCVLLGYTKIFLQNHVLHNIKLDDPFIEELYLSYFPKKITEVFKAEILNHQLAKNIASTVLVNKVINQAGVAFFFNLPGKNGQDYYRNIYNYYRAFKLMDIDTLWNLIEKGENININDKYKMLIFLTNMLKAILIYNCYSKTEIFFVEFKTFNDILNTIFEMELTSSNTNDFGETIENLANDKKAVFMRLYKIPKALDIFDIVIRWNIQTLKAINLYNFVEEIFHINSIIEHLSSIPVKTYWDFENLMLLNYKFKEFQKKLVKTMSPQEKKEPNKIIEVKYPKYREFAKLVDELLNSNIQNFSPYNVLIEEINLYFNQ